MAQAMKTERQRVHGRMIAGTSVTAVVFGIIGYCIGAALFGTDAAATIGLVFGVTLGGVVGLFVTRSVLADTLEPGISGRRYVGAQSPDPTEDDREEPPPRQRGPRGELASHR